MSAIFELEAQSRERIGGSAGRRLRDAGVLPAILYGGEEKSAPRPISLRHDDLLHRLENRAFFSHILTLSVDGEAEQVVLKALHRHPAKPIILHADFQRVSATHRIQMQVPLAFINAQSAPGVKRGGLFSHRINQVEVVCLPKDLPVAIEIDAGGLELGGSLRLSDVTLPEGVELTAAVRGGVKDRLIATLLPPRGGVGDDDKAKESAS